MLPSLDARETHVAETKHVFAWSQKHFQRSQKQFPGHSFCVRRRNYVSQFSHDENNVDYFPVPLAHYKKTRQFCYDTCIGPALRSSSQPISIWAFLLNSFTFAVQTGCYHTQRSYFFCRFDANAFLKRSNTTFIFTCIACSPGLGCSKRG